MQEAARENGQPFSCVPKVPKTAFRGRQIQSTRGEPNGWGNCFCVQKQQTVKKPSGGVGGAAAPLTFIRVSRLCRLRGSLILLAKSIPYKFGRPLVDRICFLEKVASATFSTRSCFCVQKQCPAPLARPPETGENRGALHTLAAACSQWSVLLFLSYKVNKYPENTIFSNFIPFHILHFSCSLL